MCSPVKAKWRDGFIGRPSLQRDDDSTIMQRLRQAADQSDDASCIGRKGAWLIIFADTA